MGFPELPFAEVDGLSIHARDPQLDERVVRGDIIGSRTETFVIVFEREGQALIPELVIPWFDLDPKVLNYERLAARSIQIAANPDLQASVPDAEEAPVAAFGLREAAGWGATIASVLALLWAGMTEAPRLRAWLAARRESRHASEPATFRRLMHAARSGDAQATLREADSWVSLAVSSTLTEFASRSGDPELIQAVASLLAGRYGRPSRATDPADSLRAIVRHLPRSRHVHEHRASEAGSGLPALNPVPARTDPADPRA